MEIDTQRNIIMPPLSTQKKRDAIEDFMLKWEVNPRVAHYKSQWLTEAISKINRNKRSLIKTSWLSINQNDL